MREFLIVKSLSHYNCYIYGKKKSTCQSKNWEDPLKEEMATHASILA